MEKTFLFGMLSEKNPTPHQKIDVLSKQGSIVLNIDVVETTQGQNLLVIKAAGRNRNDAIAAIYMGVSDQDGFLYAQDMNLNNIDPNGTKL